MPDMELTCPVCGADFELPEGKRIGDVITCPSCRVRLRLTLDEGEVTAAACS